MQFRVRYMSGGGARGVFGINRSRRQCQAFTSPFPSLKLNIEKGASNLNLGVVGSLYGGLSRGVFGINWSR